MRLYFKYMSMHFKSETQYKASFILSFISQFVVFFSYYFIILCLFDKFDNINGYTLYHVLLTFAIIQFGHSFCETFFKGMDHFDELIVSGEFDRILIRPKSIFMQICGYQISFIKISRLLQSIIVLIIAIIKINIKWNIEKVITLILMLFGSVAVFLEIFILSAAYCFLTLKGLEVRHVLSDGTKHMGQYPISIFSKGFRLFFIYIIPIGFINYYPLLYLLDKTSNSLIIISPIITVFYLIPCFLIFKRGIKKYTSSGS